jgi:hypothetical protein
MKHVTCFGDHAMPCALADGPFTDAMTQPDARARLCRVNLISRLVIVLTGLVTCVYLLKGTVASTLLAITWLIAATISMVFEYFVSQRVVLTDFAIREPVVDRARDTRNLLSFLFPPADRLVLYSIMLSLTRVGTCFTFVRNKIQDKDKETDGRSRPQHPII